MCFVCFEWIARGEKRTFGKDSLCTLKHTQSSTLRFTKASSQSHRPTVDKDYNLQGFWTFGAESFGQFAHVRVKVSRVGIENGQLLRHRLHHPRMAVTYVTDIVACVEKGSARLIHQPRTLPLHYHETARVGVGNANAFQKVFPPLFPNFCFRCGCRVCCIGVGTVLDSGRNMAARFFPSQFPGRQEACQNKCDSWKGCRNRLPREHGLSSWKTGYNISLLELLR